MKFNQEADYAIRMILLCSETTKLLSGLEIVSSCKIPKRWGKTILTKLCHHKILTSVKGKNGGYTINIPSEKISLFDIVNIFDPIEINTCVNDKSSCLYRFGKCSVCSNLTSLKNAIESELKKLTIKNLSIEQQKLFK